jgi:hypothetical protein
MGGDTVGVKVPVELDEGCVIMEVAVGLIPLSVLVVELQAVIKNNSNVTRRIDSDFCCAISTSFKWARLVLNLMDEAHPIFPRSVMIWIISHPIPNSLSWLNLETHMGMKSNRGCVNW